MKFQVNKIYWYTYIHINVICCNNKILSEIEREREREFLMSIINVNMKYQENNVYCYRY